MVLEWWYNYVIPILVIVHHNSSKLSRLKEVEIGVLHSALRSLHALYVAYTIRRQQRYSRCTWPWS
jgi:hypothetical protein